MINTRSIYNTIWLTIVIILSTMCTKTPPTVIIIPNTEAKPTYTIMYYAVGGETLDKAIELSITHANNSYATNVKITGCVKWTTGYNSSLSNGEGEVVRFVMGNNRNELQLEEFRGNDYSMSSPKNIADFITWSKDVAPSEHYILVIAGHGNGWNPMTDTTRGTLRDTDGRYTSLEELCGGIEQSATKFRMIHMISCSMNTIEYITALTPYADYTLASSHISVMISSELTLLKNELNDIKSDKEFVKTMDAYLGDINSAIKGNETAKTETLDFILTDCSKIDGLNSAIKDFCTSLCNIYATGDKQEIAAIEAEIAKAYYLSQENLIPEDDRRKAFTYEIVDIAQHAAQGNKRLKEHADKIKEQAEAARLNHCIRNLPAETSDVYYGVTLTNATTWQDRGYEDAGYEQTLFNSKTQWAEFLKRNSIGLPH